MIGSREKSAAAFTTISAKIGMRLPSVNLIKRLAFLSLFDRIIRQAFLSKRALIFLKRCSDRLIGGQHG
jgi:hypothetical protein